MSGLERILDDPTHGQALRFLVQHTGRWCLFQLALLLLASSLTEGLGLLLLVPITQVVAGAPVEELGSGWLTVLADWHPATLLIAVVSLVSIRAAIVYATNQLRTDIDLSLAQRLRHETYSAILGAEWRWLASRHSADHSALLTGEASRVAGLANQALFLASSVITLAVLFAAALLISAPLALAMLTAAAVVALPLVLLRAKLYQDAVAYSDAYSHLHHDVSSGLAHLRSARIAGATEVLAKRFDGTTQSLRISELRYVRQGHVLTALIQIVAAVLLAVLVYLALVVGNVALSVFVPLLLVLARAVPLFGTLVQGLRSWRHALPALGRLRALIVEARENTEMQLQSGGRELALGSALSFADARLQFDGRADPVLDKFDCTIPAHSITAVVGPSGSGKSSLGDVAAGLLGLDSGTIRIDGEKLSAENRLNWRKRVGYAEQTPFFFAGSLRENIVWARDDVSDGDLEEAIRAANAEFVHHLPSGLETPMFEGGRGFSGGERQRIALARALCRKPQLLILDEITAALDRENRETIAASIAGLKSRCTILLLTHDDGLLSLADHIIDLGIPGWNARYG